MKRPGAESATATATAIAAGVILFARVRSYPLLGWDTYPEIATSRIRSWTDLLGTFVEQTAEGHYPWSFYRPIFNLSLAADFRAWGLEAAGYHVTSTLLYIACGLALFWLAQRLLGRGAQLGRWVALLVFLLLPVQVEVVPVVSRRMDLLCGVFSAAALATLVPRVDRRAPPGGVLPVLFTLLAVGSKEAGAVLPVLVFVLACYLGSAQARWKRYRRGALIALPHLLAVGVVFGARFLALGDLGGYPTTSPLGVVTRLPWALGACVLHLIPLTRPPESRWVLDALGAAALVASAWIALPPLWKGCAPNRSTAPTTPARVTAATAACWLVLLAGIYGASGTLRPWHLFLPGMALALLLGATAQSLAESALKQRRRAPALALLGLGLFIAGEASRSPLLRDYPQWRLGARAQARYLDALAGRISETADGEVIAASLPPMIRKPAPDGFGEAATLLAIYSLPGWAELRFPDRRIVFRHRSLKSDAPDPEPGALVVRVRGWRDAASAGAPRRPNADPVAPDTPPTR